MDLPRFLHRFLLSGWNPWRGLEGLPRSLWVLFLATLINRAGSMALPFLVLYMTRELKVSEGDAGLALTAYGLGSMAASPLAGRLSDRIGPAKVMLGSLFLSAGALALFPLAGAYSMALAACIALAFTGEAFRPASLAILTGLTAPEKRKAAYALNRLAINLGMSVGPALGGFLAEWSFAAIFLVNAACSFLAGLVLVLLPLEKPSTAAEGGMRHGGRPRILRGGALGDPRLLLFLAGVLPCSMVFFQLEGALPLFVVDELGFSMKFFGALFTINTVLIVLLEVRLNLATSHWSHRRTLVLGSILVGLGFGALAFCRSPWSIWASVVVWTFGEMVLFPGMASYAAAIAPAHRRGEYMGLFTMTWAVALAVGPWLGTEVLERAGSRVLWLGALGLSLLAAALMSRVKEDADKEKLGETSSAPAFPEGLEEKAV